MPDSRAPDSQDLDPGATSYTPAQAARLTGCTETQVRYWSGTGLVSGTADGYSFRDLVALRVVSTLLSEGLSLARVRRAVGWLVASGEDVAGLRIVTDGEAVWACRDDGQILDALRKGQLALFVAVDQLAEDVDAQVQAFSAERRAFLDDLGATAASGAGSDPAGAAGAPTSSGLG